jgi:uncharacterized protein YecA (UPF0149 family)
VPCPVCGGAGHITDGYFSFVKSTIEILAMPPRTLGELSRLAEVLYAAKKENQYPDQIAETIWREVPAVTELAKIIPETRADLYGFISLIAAVIFLEIQASQNSNGEPKVTVDRVVNQLFLETDGTIKSRQQSPPTARQVGRNDPCTCGSGEKFKRCCGRINA